MSLQILSIVLYGFNQEKREIKFRVGSLNIITGFSKTGKTALIEIIDYCFGVKDCKIPEGVIRQTVEWVGIKIQVRQGEAFIARLLPDSQHQYSTAVYYEIGQTVNIPEYSELTQNTNSETIKNLLDGFIGITENVHQTPEGQTRRDLEAKISHALLFCLQQQSEVINNRHLFHKQAEQFVPQAIKDTLPYFLGAVDEDYVGKMNRLHKLGQEIQALKRKLAEHESIRGRGFTQVHTLLYEVIDAGLIQTTAVPEEWDGCINILKGVYLNPPQLEETAIKIEGNMYEQLQAEHTNIMANIHQLKDQLAAAKSLSLDRGDFSKEAQKQLNRLRSIGVFTDPEGADYNHCPLCHSLLAKDQIPPSISSIQKSITTLETKVRSVEDRSPQMQAITRKLEEQFNVLIRKLKENREALNAITESNQRLQNFKEYNAKIASIFGRIGLFLDNLPPLENTSDLQRQIQEKQILIDKLKEELSEETIQERIDSTLSNISHDMSEWAKSLNLEHSEFPFRFNLKQLTVIADRDSGPIPMDKMGSGENWLGCHIITHLALHKWFVKKNRPVPRFLFIDQPSQVYFPEDRFWELSEGESRSEDWEAVRRIYQLALQFVTDLSPEFQIIITDHAEIKEPWFLNCIIEKWRKGTKLVPQEWIDEIPRD